jgi:hypothetical protein
MRLLIAMLLASAAADLGGAAAWAGPAQIPAVEIKDAVARVTVIPEHRTDIAIEIITYNRNLPLKVRTIRGRTVIDGGLDGGKIRGCDAQGPDRVVRVAAIGDVPLRDLPHIVVRAPRDVDISAGGAVFGAIGRARNVTLGSAGCGDWTVANVEQSLQINLAGSGDARTGAAGVAKLRVTGSGDISTAAVRGRLDVDLAGAGNVRVRTMTGVLDVHMAGSGDVDVADGQATAMTVSMAGSGNVVFGGVADTLSARIAGSGDVKARQVRGQVRRNILGSGSVQIGPR